MVREIELERVTLGASGLQVSALGVGTWQWGDRSLWGYGKQYAEAEVAGAYAASRAAGITFFDTAEIYGRGMSERLLGKLVSADPAGSEVVVATKFAALPGRFTARSVAAALGASLARLGRPRIDLYQIHWPFSLITLDALMNALADQVEAGTIGAVGVSNYGARRMLRAHALLARRGVPLASNQVHYSLLHRKPERNGVLDACRELGVRLIAYSPLEQGLVTGKFHRAEAHPARMRRLMSGINGRRLRESLPAIELLERIGAAHGGKTEAQVALRWLIQRGALPIPGAKNTAQAQANAGALGWQLTPEEMAMLDALPVG